VIKNGNEGLNGSTPTGRTRADFVGRSVKIRSLRVVVERERLRILYSLHLSRRTA
jgi:hypothetical protein